MEQTRISAECMLSLLLGQKEEVSSSFKRLQPISLTMSIYVSVSVSVCFLT